MKNQEAINTAFEFNQESLSAAENILAKYPKTQRFSALMPLLTLAQKQNNNYLSKEVMEYVATYLNVSIVSVKEVATFYSMYNLEPVGKYQFQVCNSVLCNAVGSEKLYKLCKKLTKVGQKQDTTEGQFSAKEVRTTSSNISDTISADGLFSVKEVECLGACVNAPALKINDYFHNDTSEASLANLIEDLKNNQDLTVTTVVQKSLLFKNEQEK